MRTLLLTAALLLAPTTLHAQFVEIYGTLNDTQANNIPENQLLVCPGVGCPLTQLSHVSANNFRLGGGLTLNLLRAPVLKLGIDARGSHRSANGATDTALAGLKLTIHPPIFVARPYLQGSVGYIGTNATSGSMTTSAKYFVGMVFAGIDLPILKFLDFRALELGVGHAINSSGATKPSFFSASSGLALHF